MIKREKKSDKFLFTVIGLILLFCFHISNAQNSLKASFVNRPATTSINSYYVSNKKPLEPLVFIKLPVGTIKPGGWILKYLELQRDGLTGKLGEISAWLVKKNNAWFSGTGKGDHGWEEVPYWLKGYGDMGYILNDKSIINETRSWLEKVFESQRPDGFFGPGEVVRNKENKIIKVPDLWPNMIMLWCLQSYYEYSNDARVISLMTNYFKWQSTVPDSILLKTYWENSRGGDNLYSIYWLYDHTGEKWLLDLGTKIFRNTANWDQRNNLPNWHNVNIAQSFREPATYYMQTKDSTLLNATYNDFHLVRNIYGQVPGGMFGADEDARKGYTDPRQAVETCGMVEQMSSDEILSGITGDPMWADNCEDVAFNTYPAAVMANFRGLRYLTAPNMVVSDNKNHSPGIENAGPFLTMNPFSSRCCQHNHSQGWPYYEEHLWMATPDNGIAAMMYNSSEVNVKVGNRSGHTVTLKQTTHYPFDENIKIEVNTSSPVSFPLYLRIPRWCNDAKVMMNGNVVNVNATPGSYIRLENKWKQGDVIELTLPMHLTLRLWTENKNSVSLNYGPLTFSLKIKEYYKKINSEESAISDSKWQPDVDEAKWPAYNIYPASMWNYGLELNSKSLSEQFEIIKKTWPGSNFPFDQKDVPIMIKAKGKLIPEWTLDKYGLCGLLPQSPVDVHTNEETIELIPMGAARLRISAFPVVK
ncbi:MAG TPA: beta-L-arabinofuranosidase domain-containing protein [Hanamia sp.]|nr:beta-L-arabinofuranosidase domain-containing protein [Hanamia sp.]